MKFCIKIETEETYELFDDVEKAFIYLRDNPTGVLSLVYADNTFYENGVLNYEDKSNTIINELKGGKN